VTSYEKDDKSKIDRLENLHNTYFEIFDSQSQSLEKLWGDKMKNV